MFLRIGNRRSFLVAWILGLALALVPLASALAGSGGTSYPL
jgi:hypothetical protein